MREGGIEAEAEYMMAMSGARMGDVGCVGFADEPPDSDHFRSNYLAPLRAESRFVAAFP